MTDYCQNCKAPLGPDDLWLCAECEIESVYVDYLDTDIKEE